MNKSEKESLLQEYDMYSNEMTSYRNRARAVGYKPGIPKLPNRSQDPGLLRSTLSGFSKRFGNWKANLEKFEEYNSVESTKY